jgi:hypothetical protein
MEVVVFIPRDTLVAKVISVVERRASPTCAFRILLTLLLYCQFRFTLELVVVIWIPYIMAEFGVPAPNTFSVSDVT